MSERRVLFTGSWCLYVAVEKATNHDDTFEPIPLVVEATLLPQTNAGHDLVGCAANGAVCGEVAIDASAAVDANGPVAYAPLVLLRDLSKVEVTDEVPPDDAKAAVAKVHAELSATEGTAPDRPSTEVATQRLDTPLSGDDDLPAVAIRIVVRRTDLPDLPPVATVVLPPTNIRTLLDNDTECVLPLSNVQVSGDVSAEASRASDATPSDASPPPPLHVAAALRCTMRILDMSRVVAPLVQAAHQEDAVSGALPANFVTAQHSPHHGHTALLPYGCMPLYVVYDHCVHFYRVQQQKWNIRAHSAVRKLFGQVSNLKAAQLAGGTAALPRGPSATSVASSGVATRWELLREVDCTTLILGDSGFAPVAAVLRCLRGLRRLIVSHNQLSLVSAKRLVAAVRDHSGLQEIYAANNQFFELAGEELLRLLKHRTSVILLDVSKNALSERLCGRFQTMSAVAAQQWEEDPFNAISPRFDYMAHMDALPSACWQLVDPLWRMMTVATRLPPGMHGSPSPGIPVAAAAPLLSDIMRSVVVEMARVRQDPLVRSVFGPVGTYTLHDTTAASTRSVFSPAHQHNEEALYASPDAMYLQSYVKMFVTTLRVALDAPMHWDDAVHTLRGIGAQHERCGVDPILYCMANRFLVTAIETHLPEDTFTPAAKASVIQVLALMTRATVSGMKQCL